MKYPVALMFALGIAVGCAPLPEDTSEAPYDASLDAYMPGRVLGLDLFDSARTLAALLPKLAESVALDAIGAGGEQPDTGGPEMAGGFLDAIAKAEIERFAAIGLGEDLRLHAPHIAGGALFAQGRVVHLCAFRVDAPSRGEHGHEGSRLARPSQRRRGWL